VEGPGEEDVIVISTSAIWEVVLFRPDIAVSKAERSWVAPGNEFTLRFFVGVTGCDISSTSSLDLLKETTRFIVGAVDEDSAIDFAFIADLDGETAMNRLFEDGVVCADVGAFAAGYVFRALRSSFASEHQMTSGKVRSPLPDRRIQLGRSRGTSAES